MCWGRLAELFLFLRRWKTSSLQKAFLYSSCGQGSTEAIDVYGNVLGRRRERKLLWDS
jgi:hypothetical protein